MQKSWDKYFEATKDLPHSNLLKTALSELSTPTKQALDLGCGAGRDTRYLLEQGFKVTALDSDPSAGRYIRSLSDKDNVRFVCRRFIDFTFGNYSLVNAHYSLPFSDPTSFPWIFSKIYDSLVEGGIFSGQLFGIHDEWNVPDSTISFHSKDDIDKLLENFHVIKLSESEFDAKTAVGKTKYWHVFDIIARKAL